MLLSFEKQLWNHCANSGDTQAQADCIVNGTVDFLENALNIHVCQVRLVVFGVLRDHVGVCH